MTWLYAFMSGPAAAVALVTGVVLLFHSHAASARHLDCRKPGLRETPPERRGARLPASYCGMELCERSERVCPEHGQSSPHYRVAGAPPGFSFRPAAGAGRLPSYSEVTAAMVTAGIMPSLDADLVDKRQGEGVSSSGMSVMTSRPPSTGREAEWDEKIRAWAAAEPRAAAAWVAQNPREAAAVLPGFEGSAPARERALGRRLAGVLEAASAGERESERSHFLYMDADPRTCLHLLAEDVSALDGTVVGRLCPACGTALDNEGKERG